MSDRRNEDGDDYEDEPFSAEDEAEYDGIVQADRLADVGYFDREWLDGYEPSCESRTFRRSEVEQFYGTRIA